MKKLIISLLLIIPLYSIAQIPFDLIGKANKKISSTIPEGTSLKLIEFKENEGAFNKALISINGMEELININEIENISFTPTNSKGFWQNQALQHSVYENIIKNGFQYDTRNEMEEEAIEFVNLIKNKNRNFDDSYLESYLYTLVYRIYPNRLDDGRPGILNVNILKDLTPNAFIYPNGAMFISTGLLSTINSEEELIGVLAHEISHFVLDHAIINVNAAAKRKKRGEFWAALATGLAAAADIYTAANNEYYSPGAITMGTAILAYSMAESINERLGLKFSREQEMEADKCAVELLKFIGVKPTALSSALKKIKKYSIVTGNYISLTGQGSHPAIDDRIKEIGEPLEFNDIKYDKIISLVNTFNAIVELNNQHFLSTVSLAERNIKANIATEEDYVLLAMTNLYMYDNEAKNNEALVLINKAKSLNIYPNINISKQEAIVLIRLGKMNEAKKSLEKYRDELLKKEVSLDKIKLSSEWSLTNEYINKEYEWTVKMINKVTKM